MTTSDVLDCSQRPGQAKEHHYSRHAVPCEHPVGPLDTEPISVVLERLPQIPGWSEQSKGPTYLKRARSLLEWLAQHDGWQARWEAANGDTYDWVDNLTSGSLHLRKTIVAALRFLLLARVIRPSYAFFTRFSANRLFDQAQRVFDPALFAHLDQIATDLGMPTFMFDEGRKTIVKLALHTGKNVDELTEQDFFEFRQFQLTHWGATKPGLASGWDLLRAAGVLSVTGSLIEMLRQGQRPTAELVDLYSLQCRPIRDHLVRYLDERRPSLDYGSFRMLVSKLAKNFWADLEQHHPGIDSLHLPTEAAAAWKERLRVVTKPDGSTAERKEYFSILLAVRRSISTFVNGRWTTRRGHRSSLLARCPEARSRG